MKFTGRWFIGFGFFLLICGIAGFISNPTGAKTALISGGMFGGLSAIWGILMLRGISVARIAAIACTCFLAIVFTWRAAVSWMAFASGEPKLFAASLITLMLAGALSSIAVAFRRAR